MPNYSKPVYRAGGVNRPAVQRRPAPASLGVFAWLAALNLGLAMLLQVVVVLLLVWGFIGHPRVSSALILAGCCSVVFVWAYALLAHFRAVVANVTPALILANLCALVVWVTPLYVILEAVLAGDGPGLGGSLLLFVVNLIVIATGAGALAKTVVDFSPEESWLEEVLACVGYRR